MIQKPNDPCSEGFQKMKVKPSVSGRNVMPLCFWVKTGIQLDSSQMTVEMFAIDEDAGHGHGIGS